MNAHAPPPKMASTWPSIDVSARYSVEYNTLAAQPEFSRWSEGGISETVPNGSFATDSKLPGHHKCTAQQEVNYYHTYIVVVASDAIIWLILDFLRT